jgi:hypothetical protein
MMIFGANMTILSGCVDTEQPDPLEDTAAASSDLINPQTPSSCTSKFWEGSSVQTGWQAICNTLTNPPHDEWRAVANCVRDNNQNIHVTVFGPWTGGIGRWSVAHCALNYTPSTGHYETRVNNP